MKESIIQRIRADNIKFKIPFPPKLDFRLKFDFTKNTNEIINHSDRNKPNNNLNSNSKDDNETLIESFKNLKSRFKHKNTTLSGNKHRKTLSLKENSIPEISEFKLEKKLIENSSTSSISTTNNNEMNDELRFCFDLWNIEKIILKLNEKIKNQNNCFNECNDWFNNFILCNLYNMKLYTISQDEKFITKNSIGLIIFSIIVFYSVFNENLLNERNILIEICAYHEKIFLLLCEYYIIKNWGKVEKIEIDYKETYVFKLRKKLKLILPGKDISLSQYIINELKFLCHQIHNSINQFLNMNIKQTSHLISIFKRIKSIQLKVLENLYKEISNKQKVKKSISTTNIKKNSIKNTLIPYLKYVPQIKKYTLILDLDETLIHFIPENNSIEKGSFILRPGLFHFLNNMSPYFEIIIWTVATKSYADPIINIIESERRYFSYRLYRDNTTFYKNNYIKDLNNLGRDISKIIIIDNCSFNFSFQKENGILIKSFYGKKDSFELISLIPILLNIIKENDDVRIGIKKNRKEIQSKISPITIKDLDDSDLSSDEDSN